MTMLRVKMENAHANPERDFEINPVIDDGPVVTGLRTSIRKNGHWVKYTARPEDPEVTVEDLEKMAKKYGHDKVCPLVIQKCYGHNTHRAAVLEGIEDMLIDVRPISDEQMLTMMAWENKNDAKGNIMVILETVQQTLGFIENSIAGFDDFKSYKADGGTFFKNKKSFETIKQQGVGYKTALKMLEGWSNGDVLGAHRVIGDLEAEHYTKDMISGMPSITVLSQFSVMAKAIREQTWPEYFKDAMVAEAAEVICDPDISSTTKILRNATTALKDGKNPVKYIRSSQRVDFDVVKATKALVFENVSSEVELKDLPDMDGFKDYAKLDDLIGKVDTSIKRTLAGRSDDKTDEEIEAEEDAEAAGVEAAVEGEEGPTPDAALPELPPVPEEDVDAEMPIAALVSNLTRGTEYITPLSKLLIDRSSETGDEEGLLEAVEQLFTSAGALMVEYFDLEDVQAVIDNLE